MSWYDTHQAAVDPDNPAANEQITFDEWNAMVTYLKDKIIDKAVNDAAIGNDKVLVYKTATSTFVFEAQTGGAAAINDLTDVTISGVPADNEVLVYDTGTSEWINQTAAEAGLATVAGLAAYYPLTGATLTGNLNVGNYQINGVDDLQAYDLNGIRLRDSAAASKLTLATTTYSFSALATGNMGSYKIINVLDPTSAQDASTKNYDDTHLLTKEAVTSFTDGYVPVYRTASGKFEMEAGGGSAGLPVVDTTAIVKGSADGTKLMRFEVDGLTTGVTRVMTVPDKNITLCDDEDFVRVDGTKPMTGNLTMGANYITGRGLHYATDSYFVVIQGGVNGSYSPQINLVGKDYGGGGAGNIYFSVPNAAESSLTYAMRMSGISDTPAVTIYHSLDMNDKVISDMKNAAATALSGTQKDIEIDIGGTPYYFTVYPTKA